MSWSQPRALVPSEPKIREIYDESSEKHRKIKMVPFWPDGRDPMDAGDGHETGAYARDAPWSCASIPGRGGKRIHKKIRGALRNDPKGTKYAAELDVAQYYPSISGKRLIWALARKIKDKRFLRTVYSIIESCGGGLAIGYYICQWLANFYLEPLDRYIMTLPGVKYMTRYMDNITLLGPNKKQLHKARKLIAAFMQQRLGLSMKANWQIYPTAKRMVSAVGYRFSRTHVILAQAEFPALHPAMPPRQKSGLTPESLSCSPRPPGY